MRRITADELKESIADALIELLKTKTIDKIGISEITEKAEVSRASFYRYFNSKEHVLYFKFNILADRWYSGLSAEITADSLALAESFFAEAYNNLELLVIMHQAKLHHIVLQALYHIMRADVPGLSSEQRYSKAFLAYGMFGIFSEWIAGGCKESSKELAVITLQNINIAEMSL